jgi:tetratricopeptide (TPR) repeat protein
MERIVDHSSAFRMNSPVFVRREALVLPTYKPHAPDKNPMFLENRVFQGSSGRVYPLPFTDRIAEDPIQQAWDAVQMENDFLRVIILPELGGRIYRAQDKTNGYDFVYCNPVIKPALVGLAGPWISGGIEFNWPQHHRPSTYMPTDVEIEEHLDGAVTVWLSEHEPMNRMKGMHGVCLHPGKNYIELRVRVYNRTSDVQTFLWWANVATRVHEKYQSFFPPDAIYVADHAKRAISTYPLCSGSYYGVDYASRARNGVPPAERPRQYLPPRGMEAKSGTANAPGARYDPNDLSWYANIPVPTSYMCVDSREDFFGGYDHRAQAGLVHIANHHLSPGKKQWTWGNHEFGYAWGRNLTDSDANDEYPPYIELMAGVYTDNQPDFSYLQPGETKYWSQFWYPIRSIGIPGHANLEAAVSLKIANDSVWVGIVTTAARPSSSVRLETGSETLAEWIRDISPDSPLLAETKIRAGLISTDLTLRVCAADGRELIRYSPIVVERGEVSRAATEPPSPEQITNADELFLTGMHLEQYRHATRQPDSYWREGLRRDPGDTRCNLALGRWHLRRGELNLAEEHLLASIARLTLRNPNPYDGESFYQLALCLSRQAFIEDALRDAKSENPKIGRAYDAFYKATWNQSWQAASYHALAEIDSARGHWETAREHLNRALRLNADNLRARNLSVLVLRCLGQEKEANEALAETLALDPLDCWARHLRGDDLSCDIQMRLDLVLDYARAGFYRTALEILAKSPPAPESGSAPMVSYYKGWLQTRLGDVATARRAYLAAEAASSAYCFPARFEEIAILEAAIAANPLDARALFYLGNLLYDRKRHREAISRWQNSVRLEPGNAIVWRNLGIGYYNVLGQHGEARRAYEEAFRADARDARLLYERDQLWKHLGESPAKRLSELGAHLDLVRARDDLSVELCALYNQTGQPNKALAIIAQRRFQPWEGGEGQVLAQHVRTHILLGRTALATGAVAEARELFNAALSAPLNLAEAKHLLANQSDIHFWLGEACAASADSTSAREHWMAAATFKGDFQAMSVRLFSEMTFYSALSWARLGEKLRAEQLFRDLHAYADELAHTPAKIDYFATSLPTMLLFEEDLQARQLITAKFLKAQALIGLDQAAAAKELLHEILRSNPSHAPSTDLLQKPAIQV